MSVDALPRPVEPEASAWPRLRLALPHLGAAWPVATAVAAALLFALKVLRVSRGDPTVALAVAQASDKATAFAGLLLQLTPLLIVAVWTSGCFVAASQATTLT